MIDTGFPGSCEPTAFDRLWKSPYYNLYSVLAGLPCHPIHQQLARRRHKGAATPDQAQ
jgi:hypothetical protein